MFGQGLMKGLAITMRRALGKPVTELYPFEHKDPPANSRTCLAMHVLETGESACRACNTCIVACPDKVLRLVRNPDDNRHALQFVVNSARCCFCGLCVEICPYEALYFSQDYERATVDKGELIYHLVQDGHPTYKGEVNRP